MKDEQRHEKDQPQRSRVFFHAEEWIPRLPTKPKSKAPTEVLSNKRPTLMPQMANTQIHLKHGGDGKPGERTNKQKKQTSQQKSNKQQTA